jgi:hypothetical protein
MRQSKIQPETGKKAARAPESESATPAPQSGVIPTGTNLTPRDIGVAVGAFAEAVLVQPGSPADLHLKRRHEQAAELAAFKYENGIDTHDAPLPQLLGHLIDNGGGDLLMDALYEAKSRVEILWNAAYQLEEATATLYQGSRLEVRCEDLSPILRVLEVACAIRERQQHKPEAAE